MAQTRKPRWRLRILPEGRQPAQMCDALIQTASALPVQLRRSVTWDQGFEMYLHQDFSIATEMPIYFCDPGSPWQRGSNENINGLQWQYFPKGTDLAPDDGWGTGTF